MKGEARVEQSFRDACARYAEAGADAEAALAALGGVEVSMQCWQGDDVAGFEPNRGALSGGIVATGHRPGRARNADELRSDLDAAFSLVPGRHRLNLHAMYGDLPPGVDRDAIEPAHYRGWMDWAGARGIRLDFNATCFSHPMADSGYTLASENESVRSFWVEHCRRSRAVAAAMGRSQSGFCVHNLWIPDGSKDATVLRAERCGRLARSLDEIYSEKRDPAHLKDAVEGKLFGIGSESFVPGSHDFYSAYALSRGIMPCLDMGHFHPTESVADKIPPLLCFHPELLVHVSRGVRWDSDHVPIEDDGLLALSRETVRSGGLGRVHFALDFFDAGMNRVGAWVLGARALQKCLLAALLEPIGRLRSVEAEGDRFMLAALIEEQKHMPMGAVWDFHCLRHGVPHGEEWVRKARDYEAAAASERG